MSLWAAPFAHDPTDAAPGTSASSAVVPSAEGPTEVVQNAARDLLRALDKDRDAYRRDPAKLERLVQQYLLPRFDTEAAARAVLGKHWRTATPEQRRRFTDALRRRLLANYGNALLDFTSDRLQVFPARVGSDAQYATVRTTVRRSNGSDVDVKYELRKTPEGWKAWNFVIEGVSYIHSLQEDFGSQIEAEGIDAVIRRLESGDKPVAHPQSVRGS